MRDNSYQSIEKLLKVVIALMLRGAENEKPLPMRDQIKLLSSLGLKPAEVAEIIGRKGKYGGKEIALINKKQRG